MIFSHCRGSRSRNRRNLGDAFALANGKSSDSKSSWKTNTSYIANEWYTNSETRIQESMNPQEENKSIRTRMRLNWSIWEFGTLGEVREIVWMSFLLISDESEVRNESVTDWPTDRPTDQPTNRPTDQRAHPLIDVNASKNITHSFFNPKKKLGWIRCKWKVL